MRIAANIAGALLGLIFVVLPVLILAGVIHQPPPPVGSPPALFMGAMYPTGYLMAVQILEIIGGVLVAIPATRNFGLLVLGPIVINILCFHVFIAKGAGLVGPPLVVAVLAAFLLVAERHAFLGLLHRAPIGLAASIPAGLLGFMFVALSSLILLRLLPIPPPTPGSPADLFAQAMGPSGYMTTVQILEIIGGILVAIPRTRNFGLLVLGPIVLNILFFHVFIAKGAGLIGPPLLIILLAAFLLFAERRSFIGLLHRS